MLNSTKFKVVFISDSQLIYWHKPLGNKKNKSKHKNNINILQ